MKKSLTLMLAATSAFFFACSDDSSSDNGTGGNGGKVTIEYSGSIKVDAENQTMVVAIPETLEPESDAEFMRELMIEVIEIVKEIDH